MGADMGRTAVFLGLAMLVSWLAGCQPPAAPAPVPPEYDLGLDMKTLMTHVIEAAAEVPWDSAGEVVTAAGVQDLAPTDEEGWIRVEAAGAMLVEAGNLLLMPGRDRGTGDWKQFSKSLSAMGHEVMAAAKSKDKDALFQAGADLYSVCVACHQAYALDLPVKVDLGQGGTAAAETGE
jgi:hypothetical protein